MSDGTQRIISMNGGVFPFGESSGQTPESFTFEFVPSTTEFGTTTEPNKAVLPTLEEAVEVNPSELKAVEGYFDFTSWEYYEPQNKFDWNATLYVDGVKVGTDDVMVYAGQTTPLEIFNS